MVDLSSSFIVCLPAGTSCFFAPTCAKKFPAAQRGTMIFDETTSFSGLYFESAVDLCLKQTLGKMLNTSAMMSTNMQGLCLQTRM